jgi:hypothetical protein
VVRVIEEDSFGSMYRQEEEGERVKEKWGPALKIRTE